MSKAQDIGTALAKCTTKAKKPLIYKDFQAFFNDKKKTVG